MISQDKAKLDQVQAIIKKHKVPACLTVLTGTCIGCFSDYGLNREEIAHVLDFLADGTEKIKNDPKALESIKNMQSAIGKTVGREAGQ